MSLRIGHRRELGLDAPVLDVACGLVGHGLPALALHDVEGHVDPRRDARRGDDAVVHDAPLAIDLDTRVEAGEEVEGAPVRRGAPAPKEAGLGEEERARAY